MQPGLWWLVCGVVLLVVEVLAPGVFMMWLGLAAIGTGGVTLWFEPGIGWQVVAYAVFAAATLSLGLRLRVGRKPAMLNTAQAGLTGRTARVLAADAAGIRVRVGDSDWTARLAHGVTMPAAGAVLRVVGVDGTTLVVGD
ncbi:MAG: NfeD family protein [Alphaproteobacteria bacterium]|nr:NfeD family protein [Alphaproteobacteria bacterium]